MKKVGTGTGKRRRRMIFLVVGEDGGNSFDGQHSLHLLYEIKEVKKEEPNRHPQGREGGEGNPAGGSIGDSGGIVVEVELESSCGSPASLSPPSLLPVVQASVWLLE